MKKNIDYTSYDINDIATVFINFAENECKESSKMYFQLSHQIAKEKQLLEIAAKTRYLQPIPNIFLAAIHFLLLKNSNEPLAEYYPTINPLATNSEIPFPLFKSFVLENKERIIALIQTKIVQTNVINRCAYLLPIFSAIIEKEQKEVAIVDIGTSAGLTLNWDKYQYKYNSSILYGQSTVQIECEIRNSELPTIYSINFPIEKIGVDQQLILINDEEEQLWLKALIWADHVDRFNNISAALRLNEQSDTKFIEAATIKDFETILRAISKNKLLIVYATHVLYQFSEIDLIDFNKMLDSIGMERDFYFLSVEGTTLQKNKYKTSDTVVELTQYKNGIKSQKLVALTNGHGNWICWK